MFLGSVKSRNGQPEYLHLVESFRAGDKVKQRIVAHLGRKDLLAPHIDALIRLLAEPEGNPGWVAVDNIPVPRASTWGPVLVARHLFEKLCLGAILDAGDALRRHGQPLWERILSLLANRLGRPGSQHALAQWLEDSMCAQPKVVAGCRYGNSPAGQGGLRSVEVVVSEPGRSASRERAHRKGGLPGVARSVQRSIRTWFSTTLPRRTSKGPARRSWDSSAIAATASRVIGRSSSGW